jgi:5-methylcytosine-specific restriction protein A
MPPKLKTICNHPGCGTAVRDRYCDVHRQQAYDRPSEHRRGTAAQRGYDHRWRRLRDWHLRRQPLCEDCLDDGIVNAENLEVDHLIPIDVRPDLRLAADNLRTRCRHHHSIKTMDDKRRYGAAK